MGADRSGSMCIPRSHAPLFVLLAYAAYVTRVDHVGVKQTCCENVIALTPIRNGAKVVNTKI